MANRSTWVTAGITLAALAITPVAVAQAGPDPSNVDSTMVAALASTLGVTPEQALARIGRESSFAKAEAGLRAATGGEFGGAYLNDDATVMTVAVTNARHFARVRASGGNPVLVGRSESDLLKATERLDKVKAPQQVPSWYPDVRTNKVAVLVRDGALATAQQWVGSAGLPRAC